MSSISIRNNYPLRGKSTSLELKGKKSLWIRKKNKPELREREYYLINDRCRIQRIDAIDKHEGCPEQLM